MEKKEINEEENKKSKNKKTVKRKISIITVFLWIFLVATMITMVGKNINRFNLLEENEGIERSNIKTYKVGEEINAFALVPHPGYCIYCGNLIVICVPEEYDEIRATMSNNEVISNITYSWGKWSSNDMYKDLDCLKAVCIATKPGITTLQLKYDANYCFDSTSIYCNECGMRTTFSSDYTWYSYGHNYNITITADYVLSYEANVEDVTGMPDTVVESDISEDIYDITVSSDIPERKGYEFLGWSENPDDEIVMYTPGNKVTLKWEAGDTVERTLYAVWRPEKTGGSVIYSWTGLPENANIDLPQASMYNFDDIVAVDSRKAGDIIVVNGFEYMFSGWSSDEIVINENKFKMPEGNVIIKGKWEKIPQKVNLKVEKIWEDDDNQALKRPESVTLQIYGDDKLIEERVVSELDNWSFEIELPKHNELEEEIVYTVDEKEISKFYEKEISGYTVINKFVVPDEKTKVKVIKLWEDDNNKLGKRPESVILQVKFGNEVIAEREVNESDNWSYEFEVPKYDELGKEFVYTVDEKETTSEYIKEIEGNVITNRIMYYDLPDTSDINILIYIIVFIVAIIGVIVVVVLLKKNKK